MEHPKHSNRMSHFDSSATTEEVRSTRQVVGPTAHFSDRVRCALEEEEKKDGSGDSRGDAAEGVDDKHVKPPAPGDSDGDESGGDKGATEGGTPAEGNDVPEAPEPKEKTPQELNDDPADAVYGDDPSIEKEQNFGPHTGQPKGELK